MSESKNVRNEKRKLKRKNSITREKSKDVIQLRFFISYLLFTGTMKIVE